jgi:hypothetical protein
LEGPAPCGFPRHNWLPIDCPSSPQRNQRLLCRTAQRGSAPLLAPSAVVGPPLSGPLPQAVAGGAKGAGARPREPGLQAPEDEASWQKIWAALEADKNKTADAKKLYYALSGREQHEFALIQTPPALRTRHLAVIRRTPPAVGQLGLLLDIWDASNAWYSPGRPEDLKERELLKQAIRRVMHKPGV